MPSSQASYVPEPALLQDGREVHLGDIILESAVAENYSGVAGGLELGMPLGNSEGQRLDLLPGDFFVEAGDQRAGADGAHGLTRDGPALDGHTDVEPQLQ